MKKLVTLLLTAGLMVGAAGLAPAKAQALEVKVDGYMDFTFEGYQNMDNPFRDYRDSEHNAAATGLGPWHQKHSGAVQRFRVGIEFIISENLSAYYQAQIGTFTWGGPANGASEDQGGYLGSRASNIVTRYAYLDWMIPRTEVRVRMGQQPVALPSYTFGSPVLDDSAAGIVVSAPITNNIGVTGFWLRADSYSRRANPAVSSVYSDDLVDLFGMVGSFCFDGFEISPWGMFGMVGKDANYYPAPAFVPGSEQLFGSNRNSTLWMVGIGGELTMFDPFRFTLDGYYSALDNKHGYGDAAGWYAALGAEYKTAYGTPALKGWYASGDNGDFGDGSEQPLTISGTFNPTTTYFDGRYSIANTIDRTYAAGTWGVSLQWNGLSFMENLSHDFAVTYFTGTNDKHNLLDPGRLLTTKDSAWEFDFNSTYDIYENLATVLELAYIIEDFDGKNAARNLDLGDYKLDYSDTWRAALNFRYSF